MTEHRLIADAAKAKARTRMSEVKRFRITGEIKKGKTKVPFSVEFNAVKKEHALQRLYSEMGSRHRARRFEIEITKIESAREEEPAQAKG